MKAHKTKMKYPTTKKTLIERISTGDNVSWEEFYNRYANIVRSLGTAKGLASAECDDLLQAVMVAFFQRSKTFIFDPSKAKFRTYFGYIVSTKIADIYHKRNIKFDQEQPDMNDSSPDVILNGALLAEWRTMMLDEAIEQLKMRLNRPTFIAFDLYARQGLPVEEVAEMVGISVKSVYTAKSRAQKTLRQIVAELNAGDAELELPNDEI